MTVSELIEALSKMPRDMDVEYDDLDLGPTGIGRVEIRDVQGGDYRAPKIPVVVLFP